MHAVQYSTQLINYSIAQGEVIFFKYFLIWAIDKLFAILCKQSHPALQNLQPALNGWKMSGNGDSELIGLISEVDLAAFTYTAPAGK